MIDYAGNLLVFENFWIDRTLPKFVGSPKKGSHASLEDFSVSVGEDVSYTMSMSNRSIQPIVLRGRTFRDSDERPSALVRLFQWFINLLLFREEKPQITVEQFFLAVKGSTQNIELVKERADGYMHEIVRARQAGQGALAEQLVDGMAAYRMETHLLAMDLPRFIEEEDMVKFYKQSKKGLKLDWIKNFVRRIPDDVLEMKAKADEVGTFDNYAVLHYDPDSKAYSETKQEVERRKDPILFGLMRGRRRLYFVGDWVDEYCDLTLDQIADAVGKDFVKDLNDVGP